MTRGDEPGPKNNELSMYLVQQPNTHRLPAAGLLKWASNSSAARLGAACSPPDTAAHSAE